MPKFVLPAIASIVGAVAAFVLVAGAVSSATAAPKHNPANQALIQYGNR